MIERGIECNNDPCNCVVAGAVETGEAYCSDSCRVASEEPADACACGHPPCDEP
ncbi:MAG TPA: hypothetical protein VMF61_00990 [Candidatus Acidoferrales bacterium]|nr:hypothetical protein [Candidatus Acidoferrales bacterium]